METVSTKVQCLIDHLLHVHALASMARASERKEHFQSAAAWLPQIESTVKSIREELESILR